MLIHPSLNGLNTRLSLNSPATKDFKKRQKSFFNKKVVSSAKTPLLMNDGKSIKKPSELRILILEDLPHVSGIISNLLKTGLGIKEGSGGYIKIVTSYDLATKELEDHLISKEPYDLIIHDNQLTDGKLKDKPDYIKLLEKVYKEKAIPVIWYSTDSLQEKANELPKSLVSVFEDGSSWKGGNYSDLVETITRLTGVIEG